MAYFNQFRFGFGKPSASDAFQFTVKTDNTGTSNNNQFTIPLYSGETYDFTVSYDGQETTHNTSSDLTLTFPSGAGAYPVVITGTFPGIFFNGGGDRLKLTGVAECGDVGWSRLDAAFQGCSNCLSFCGSIPYNASITSLQNTWRDCSGAASFPDISNLVDVTNLYRTWRGCSSATSFPVINTLTLVNTLREAWNGCSSATSFPDVNTLTLVNTLQDSWNGCSSATSFSDVSNLTNVTTMYQAWGSCSSCAIVPVLPSASTSLTNCGNMFLNIGSGMGGTVVELWNATNFPNVTTYTDCFTGATGLSNYADIPNDWKGL